ncbi:MULTISPECIES: hypothetical protein [unclassified Kitasatospora]|uniref:hypothetical protein n=1 Tax=unclassified Kitasatospora TaxID=2633591 RepID=UPI0033F662B5
MSMLVALDHPEFPYAEPAHGITCWQKPWNGVLVRVDQIPFKAGDELTFDVTVCSDFHGPTPAATIKGVVSITADTTTVDYTIPWDGVLDAVTEGSLTVSYTLTPSDGSEPTTSEGAMVRYSRRQRVGAVCGPDSRTTTSRHVGEQPPSVPAFAVTDSQATAPGTAARACCTGLAGGAVLTSRPLGPFSPDAG